jgi:nitroimidazol reductase NimA-like FMN-containing flavoprotein (pyridoxamine 5'-phosphate oxidase superfamily)
MDPQARSGLDVMTRAECLRLLGTRSVGRLGFLVGDQPMVLPVNYGSENGVVVFRTREGAKLDGTHNGKVAFEVDDLDADGCAGWSVVVQGLATDITGNDDWFDERLRALAGPACVPGVADHYVRIAPTQISGRRFPAKPRRAKKGRRMVLPAWVPGDAGHRFPGGRTRRDPARPARRTTSGSTRGSL